MNHTSIMSASSRRSMTLSAVMVGAVLATLCTPTLAFTVGRSAIAKKMHVQHKYFDITQRQRHTTTSSALNQEIPNNNSQEKEMMDAALREEQFRQGVQQGINNLQSMPENSPRPQKIDPLIASLTRIDEPTPSNVPTRQVPLFGEVPADGNLALLVPAAAIAVLGFLFSIVVAFNSRDAIVQELSQVELPEMKYTPTKVEEGKCRGLCSSQDEDLNGLKNFMEGISNSKVQDL